MVLRSNSLATKAIELYLKQVGGSYLKSALGDFVTSVLAQTTAAAAVYAANATLPEPPLSSREKRGSLGRQQTSTRCFSAEEEQRMVADIVDFEVDPDKVTNSRQLLRNQGNLMKLVRNVWRRIQATISAFPK